MKPKKRIQFDKSMIKQGHYGFIHMEEKQFPQRVKTLVSLFTHSNTIFFKIQFKINYCSKVFIRIHILHWLCFYCCDIGREACFLKSTFISFALDMFN